MRRERHLGSRHGSQGPAGTSHIVEVAVRAFHEKQSVVGPGCDDQFEEFAQQGWSSSSQPAETTAGV